jgi:hypothetical protein
MITEGYNAITESNRAIEHLQDKAYEYHMNLKAAKKAAEWGIKSGLIRRPLNEKNPILMKCHIIQILRK